MKLIVIGNPTLISSATLEQHEDSVQLIVNTRQRWPRWSSVGTSVELNQQQPHLHQCCAFDFFAESPDTEDEFVDKATLVLVAENDADKELIDTSERFSHLEKDQLVIAWLWQDPNFPVVQLAAFSNKVF